MKKTLVALLVGLALAAGYTVAGAATIDLFEYQTMGGAQNISLFNTSTGLGTLQLTATGAGVHNSGLFVDHEIDQYINTWFNEKGAIGGSAPLGVTWEIDEPGYVFGDIKTNFAANTLDNMIFNGDSSLADDVSMALAWHYVLSAGETATIKFNLSETAPAGGFFLRQYDPDSGDASVYLTSTLKIGTDVATVPEPSTLLLLGAGLAGLGICGRRRGKK